MAKSLMPRVLLEGLVKEATNSTGNPFALPNPFRSSLLTPLPKSLLIPSRSIWNGQTIQPRPGPHSDIINPQRQELPPTKPPGLANLAKQHPWAVMYQNPLDPDGARQKAVSGN